MNKKLHVGNLPAWITDQELSEKFARFGTVEFAAVFKDAVSGNSRGFGLVEMSDTDGAQKAIQWLNFSSFEGQILAVSFFAGQSAMH